MEPLRPMNSIGQPHDDDNVSWPRRAQSILILVLGVALAIFLGFSSAEWSAKVAAVVAGVAVVILSEIVLTRMVRRQQ